MDSEGTVSEKKMSLGAGQAELGQSDEVESSDVSDTLLETKENATTVTTTRKAVAKSDKEDSKKSLIQDRTVYKAYFKTVGTFHTVVFIMFGVVFAFTLKFPSMLPLA